MYKDECVQLYLVNAVYTNETDILDFVPFSFQNWSWCNVVSFKGAQNESIFILALYGIFICLFSVFFELK